MILIQFYAFEKLVHSKYLASALTRNSSYYEPTAKCTDVGHCENVALTTEIPYAAITDPLIT